MCGICGHFNLKGAPADERRVSAMQAKLFHRGPDDSGLWSGGAVAFGFQRLSILDLEGGHQPMVSKDGRFALVFNGEIYNHPRLKLELESEGVVYRTRSDTETILHLFEKEGKEAFRRLEGMFAIALWDGQARELFLARDSLGVKPLYYALNEDSIFFSSELRPLLAAGVSRELDRSAICEYLRYGRVHAPRTALAAVRKLMPGHLLHVHPGGTNLERFWSTPPRPEPRRWTIQQAQDGLEKALTESIRGQLLSDVPVGAFLSGGVDSALVTALMTRVSGKSVSTFTIGFSNARAGLDESRWAREVSRRLGTDHHELILPADVLNRIEDLAPCLDEPIADSAILPTYLLARFARQGVKVVLTGEGADELFAGYGRYKAAYLSERLLQMPKWMEKLASPIARKLGRGPLFQRLPMETVGQWAQALAESDKGSLQGICLPDFLSAAYQSEIEAFRGLESEEHDLSRALVFDLRTVLCDGLLMKVDKATMRASLEARVPFLDRRLVEFALSLPSALKIRRFKGKYILRRLASKFLPDAIVWRRKHGFHVPWEEWVRERDNTKVRDLVFGSSLGRQGIFDLNELGSLRERLVSGDRSADAGLFFRVAVLGLWLESLV